MVAVFNGVQLKDLLMNDYTTNTISDFNSLLFSGTTIPMNSRILFINQWYDLTTLKYKSFVYYVLNVDTSPLKVEVINNNKK